MTARKGHDNGVFLIRSYEPAANSGFAHRGSSGWLLRDAARATSAAPFYFDPFSKDGAHYVDGGVGFNNPCELAINEACALRRCQPSQAVQVIVSLGTGDAEVAQFDPSRRQIMTIKDLLSQQATNSHDVHERMLQNAEWMGLKGRYFRFNPKLSGRAQLDLHAESDLKALKTRARNYLQEESVAASFNAAVDILQGRGVPDAAPALPAAPLVSADRVCCHSTDSAHRAGPGHFRYAWPARSAWPRLV